MSMTVGKSALVFLSPLNQGVLVYFCVTIGLYKLEKWLYYINICINKTVVNQDSLCAALMLFVFFNSSAIM